MANNLKRASLLAGLAAALAGDAYGAEPVRQAFDLQVMNPPAAVELPGSAQFVYELHVTNFARDSLTLSAIEALDAATGKVVGEFRGEELEAALGRPGLAADDKNRRAVAPGMRAIVYLSVPADGALSALRHRVLFEANDAPERWTIEGGETSVDGRSPLKLGPPLQGGPWAAIFHPDWERGHRRVVYAVDGKALIPGRFAVDWMRARDAASPDQSDGHGADVLAVADARVVAARDDFKQPEDGHASIPLEEGNGNYVTLDLGGGRYAFYEHLAQGVRVKIGDRVKKGDVIGALGATGHVTHPHLHFHVSDANSPLGAEGLPYALMNFHALGAYDSIEAFRNGETWRVFPPGELKPGFTFPSPMMVVEFSGSLRPGSEPDRAR